MIKIRTEIDLIEEDEGIVKTPAGVFKISVTDTGTIFSIVSIDKDYSSVVEGFAIVKKKL